MTDLLSNHSKQISINHTIPGWWIKNANELFYCLSTELNKAIYPGFQGNVISALSRGRLLRGSLALQMITWLGLELEISERKKLIKLLSLVEIVHSAACIFDDIIDQDPIRRGAPSFATRSGLPAAILTALHMVNRAITTEGKLLGSENFRLSSAFDSMVIGEAADTLPEFAKDNSSLNMLDLVVQKTVPLFGASFHYVGASCFTANNSRIFSCESFGETLGKLYQLANDYHDTFSIGPLARGDETEMTLLSWSLPVQCAINLNLIDSTLIGKTFSRLELQVLYDKWQNEGVAEVAMKYLLSIKKKCHEEFDDIVPPELDEVLNLICSKSFWSYFYAK